MKCKECGEMPPTLRNVIEGAVDARECPLPLQPSPRIVNQVERSYHIVLWIHRVSPPLR